MVDLEKLKADMGAALDAARDAMAAAGAIDAAFDANAFDAACDATIVAVIAYFTANKAYEAALAAQEQEHTDD